MTYRICIVFQTDAISSQEEQARSLRKSELQAKFAQEPTSSDSVSLAFMCRWPSWSLQARAFSVYDIYTGSLMVEESNGSLIVLMLCGRSMIMLNWSLEPTPKKCLFAPQCLG
jgi:hypothetical protein